MGCGCNKTTTCNSCNQTSCGCKTTSSCTDCCTNTCPCTEQPCGCEVELSAECIRYEGEDLPCAGITKGDTLEAALQAINEKLCVSGSYITVVNVIPGENCESGGIQINVFDTETDELLDTIYLCIPQTNYIDVVVEEAGVNCENGGVAINIYSPDDVLLSTEYLCNPTCCPAKENFYVQAVSTVDIVADPSFVDLTYFQPVGYTTLTYTNTSGAAKTYFVNVSYETTTLPLTANSATVNNWLDGAIIKTVSAVDSVEYESLNTTLLSAFLFDGATSADVVNIASPAPDQVLTTAGNPVEVRFLNGGLPKNTAFFYVLTLNDTESVSLKFKSKAGEEGWLLRAQMFINEID